MRRFLVLVLASLLPLQLAVTAIVPVCGAHGGTAHAAAVSARIAARAAAVCEVPAQPAPHHGAAGHHACSHIGLAFIGAPCAALAVATVPDPPPVAAPVAFDSIVLDVPLPPPTVSC